MGLLCVSNVGDRRRQRFGAARRLVGPRCNGSFDGDPRGRCPDMALRQRGVHAGRSGKADAGRSPHRSPLAERRRPGRLQDRRPLEGPGQEHHRLLSGALVWLIAGCFSLLVVSGCSADSEEVAASSTLPASTIEPAASAAASWPTTAPSPTPAPVGAAALRIERTRICAEDPVACSPHDFPNLDGVEEPIAQAVPTAIPTAEPDEAGPVLADAEVLATALFTPSSDTSYAALGERFGALVTAEVLADWTGIDFPIPAAPHATITDLYVIRLDLDEATVGVEVSRPSGVSVRVLGFVRASSGRWIYAGVTG